MAATETAYCGLAKGELGSLKQLPAMEVWLELWMRAVDIIYLDFHNLSLSTQFPTAFYNT